METAALAVGATVLQTGQANWLAGNLLLCFPMQGMFFVPRTILAYFKPTSGIFLVLSGTVIASLAFCTRK